MPPQNLFTEPIIISYSGVGYRPIQIELGYINGEDRIKFSPLDIPVSYTHLDVYKRQPQLQ